MILGSGRRTKTKEDQNTERPKKDEESEKESTESDVETNGPQDAERVEKIAKKEMPRDETLEPWSEWIKRTTHQTEKELAKMKIDSWVTQARRQKWRFAQRIAAHDPARWTRRAAAWDPALLFDGRCRASRAQARPKKRWADDIVKFLDAKIKVRKSWMEVAKDTKWWKSCEDEFCCM